MANLAVSKPAPKVAQHPLITATGLKGFLQWMKTDPAMSVVYPQIAPQLAQTLGAAPAGSGLGSFLSNIMGHKHARMGSLGCCCFYSTCEIAGSESGVCDYSLSQSVPNASLGSNLCDSITAAAPSDAVGSAALVNSVANLINTGASVALTASEISNANAVTNAQLARAAAGYSPLNLSTTGGMVMPSSLSSLFSGSSSSLLWLALIGGGIYLITQKK